MVARAFGQLPISAKEVDAAVETMRRRMGESSNEYRGTSVAGIVKGLRSYGLEAQAIWSIDSVEPIRAELAKGRLVIAHVVPTYLWAGAETGHYTVVTAIENGKVYLNDPASRSGPVIVSVSDFWRAVRKRGTYAIVSAGPKA